MTTAPYYADDLVTLHHVADCLDGLATLDDCSVDAVVTDPPYGIGFMGHSWDQPGVAARPGGTGGRRHDAGPIGHDHKTVRDRSASMHAGEYDLSRSANARFGAWCESWARECLRVLKPGGYLLSFGAPRTWHRLACAVEDAGFEIRDSIAWLFGSGFPKSLNLGDGRGTALKPGFEPIVMGRKPLVGTVAKNLAEHGTGALNIDACRIAISGGAVNPTIARRQGATNHLDGGRKGASAQHEARGRLVSRTTPERYREERPGESLGRWPTNVVLDNAAAAELDAQTGVLTSGTMRAGSQRQSRTGGVIFGADQREFVPADTYGDSGGASRFFPTFRYEPKAPTVERPVLADGTQHPTVKPLDLMRWCVRLITPPGGLVLDLFAGSGTTGEACVIEGRRCLLFERHQPYCELIVQRLTKPIAVDMFGAIS